MHYDLFNVQCSQSPHNRNRGFLNANEKRSAGGGAPLVDKRNFLVKFWQDEITSPEKAPGNVAIAGVTAMAGVAVILFRTLGKDLLVPQF